ncbi:calcium sensor EFh [Chlorella sorokiniana]|uniref:Calcium sensor EFh n=1 Tax=Chlorella sorokiniana TaxID=3076 RepID=A0A2P6TZ73_CHLSO|nr:calcium sensor EFh [Chlorella sorokiniana]|eukprot:PRW59367.1 calcium sensor EFh [Chlorella sorokiniana]
MITLSVQPVLATAPARQSRRCGLARPFAAACRRPVLVRATKQDEEEKKKIQALEESLKKSGIDRDAAQQVLKMWRENASADGKEITPEDLRKVLVKQGSKLSMLVVIQVFLDLGAAYGALVAGNFLGEASLQYGVAAVALQAVAYFLSGYYAMGAFFDLFKLGMVLTATYQFNVNSAAFLTAVQELAGNTGLSTVDKAVDAVNTLKVISGLNKMADLLKEQKPGGPSSNELLKDLAAYLTLEKAQRLYGFSAAQHGITDAQAAEIATVFSAFDSDENGYLSLDEFQQLCARYAPDLSAAEVKAGMEMLDANSDKLISLTEFVDWALSAFLH